MSVVLDHTVCGNLWQPLKTNINFSTKKWGVVTISKTIEMALEWGKR